MGLSDEEAAEKLKLSEQKWTALKENPERIPLNELYSVANIIGPDAISALTSIQKGRPQESENQLLELRSKLNDGDASDDSARNKEAPVRRFPRSD